MKLNDLSYILEAYQAGIEGRYQDGASEFMAAAARAGEAELLRESDVWFFGFDMMPPALHGLIAAVAAACDGTHLLLPLDNDPNARDFDAFLPMQRAFERLCTAARRAGTQGWSEFSSRRRRTPPERLRIPRPPAVQPADKASRPALRVALRPLNPPRRPLRARPITIKPSRSTSAPSSPGFGAPDARGRHRPHRAGCEDARRRLQPTAPHGGRRPAAPRRPSHPGARAVGLSGSEGRPSRARNPADAAAQPAGGAACSPRR